MTTELKTHPGPRNWWGLEGSVLHEGCSTLNRVGRCKELGVESRRNLFPLGEYADLQATKMQRKCWN